MVCNFHRNKWIAGGDSTKTVFFSAFFTSINLLVLHVLLGLRRFIRSHEKKLGHKRHWCNASAGHGQMMDVGTSYSDFINCDRTGRRNAVPDITGEEGASASTSELSKDMAGMDLKASDGNPGPSPAPETEGSPSQDSQGGGGDGGGGGPS